MKILELKAENIKNLKAIAIKADPNTNILEGKIGAGKSAILDSIFVALTGKKVDEPIREGQEKANIEVNLGEYIVKKVFTKAGDRLEVLSPQGAKYPSPQSLLNKIYGKLGFDPLDFSRMKNDEQKTLLKQLVGLDFSKLDSQKLEYYNERTFKNREIKNLESILDSLKFDSGVPENEISINDQMLELEKLEQEQKDYNEALDDKEDMNSSINKLINNIENKRKDIDNLKEQIKNLETEISKHIEDLDNLNNNFEKIVIPENPIDKIQKVKEEIKNGEIINIAIRENKKYKETKEKLDILKDESNKLSEKMSQIEEEKLKQIQGCKYPIEGLGINEDAVIYNGRSFSMLSTGEKIMVSTSIAMALNPNLKVILIREGALLDKEGLASIIKVAKEKDYQLWIEKTSDEKTG
jgi:hypothetical protein